MSKKVKLGSNPSDRQRLFLNCATKEQLYGGAKRGGKSVALVMKGIMLSVLYPGNRGGLFRQDLTDLRDSLLVTFFQICPPELILNHHQTHKMITVDTGAQPSHILYGGLGDAHDVESAKGKEFGWFGIDEPSETDPEAYRMLLAQLCWRLPDGSFPPYMALLTSNPEPGWVEEKFRTLIEEVGSGTQRSESTDGRKTYIQALPRNNPYLPPNWELEQRIDAPEVWQKKYLDGSWEVSEGQVYKEYDKATHVIDCPPPAFLSRLKLVASIDHATTGITCMAVDGIDPDGNVFALGEYYERNRLISEHAKGMQTLMDRWVDLCGLRHVVEAKRGLDPQSYAATTAFEYILIDPSTQAKTQQNRNELWSVQDEYRRNGIPTQAAWNTMETGINLMQEYLHIKPTHIHPLTGQRGAPSFFIIREQNPNGQREIVGWRKTISAEGKPKYIGSDHWLDNQRYIVMSRPEPPRISRNDILSMDTASRIAQRDLLRFDKKFKRPGADSGQWFPGGSDGQNTWFPRN
jgi:hypothetical protein